MREPGAGAHRHEIRRLVLLLLLAYPLYFHHLGARDIWSPDEDEYVLVNREMVLEGHWIYPTVNGEPYNIKPPLFNWLGSAISVAAGEVNEFTSRLPSALAATVGLVVLYLLGRLLFGVRAGWLSALVLATSPLYVEFGRWIQINMISTVLLTATLALFAWGYRDERKRPLAYLLMYVPVGLGTLNMGLVNVAMPVLVIGLYLLVRRDLKHLLRLRLGWGLVVYLAVVAPWYTAVSLRGEYAHRLLVVTNFTRYFEEWAHVRPFCYYLGTTPPYFLPWLFYLPGALFLCFAKRARDDRAKLLLPFVWMAALFVFFSLSKTKRSEYLLPIFPALALLVGYTLDRSIRHQGDPVEWRRLFVRPTTLMLAALVAAAAGGTGYAAVTGSEWLLPTLPITGFVVLGSPIAWFLLRKGRGGEVVVTIALILTATVAHGVGPIVGRLNEEKSAKPFCRRVNAYLSPGERIKVYRFVRPIFGVYTERRIEHTDRPETLAAWFASEKPVYVITKERHYEALTKSAAFPHPVHVVLREWIDRRYVVLLSNRPPRPPR